MKIGTEVMIYEKRKRILKLLRRGYCLQRVNLELVLTRERTFQLRTPFARNKIDQVPLFIIKKFVETGKVEK